MICPPTCTVLRIILKKMGAYWKEGSELRGCLSPSRTDCPMVEAIETGFPCVPVIQESEEGGGDASFEMDA